MENDFLKDLNPQQQKLSCIRMDLLLFLPGLCTPVGELLSGYSSPVPQIQQSFQARVSSHSGFEVSKLYPHIKAVEVGRGHDLSSEAFFLLVQLPHFPVRSYSS